MRYLYLHGFASSPGSQKGRYFQARMAEKGIELIQPDLNRPTFETLTLTAQLEAIDEALQGSDEPVTIIGSSMGGLLATLQAIRDPRVARLVLMAPAFRFIPRWKERLGPEGVAEWRRRGGLPIQHFAYRKECMLEPGLLDDAEQYDEERLHRPIPILIFHGLRDESVDWRGSEAFAKARPYVRLELYDTDHGMLDVLDRMWAETVRFCGLEG